MTATVRLLPDTERTIGQRHATGALDLARRLPRLAIEARRVAATVTHGVHGRRRAGSGENFWQFRPFVAGEPAGRIDWRRSARDDRHYVRERELEAAHTVWLWADRSVSMAFQSSLAQAPKLDRALVLALALADILVRGGERVGWLDLHRAVATRAIVDRFASALASAPGADGLPVAGPLPPLTEAVLIGDFLVPPADIAAAIERLSSRGARGHLVMVVDPVEETFPFSGNALLVEPEAGGRLRVGDAAAFRLVYRERIAAHRAAIERACRSRGWSFALHHTDASAAQTLLALAARVASPAQAFAIAKAGNGA
jgi:uncharacterized protein (DUF58 family)